MNMMLCVIVVLALCLTLSAHAGLPREWMSTDGRKMQAALLSATAQEAVLVLANGQKVTVALSGLSQGDQDHVQQWLANQAALATNFGIQLVQAKRVPGATYLKYNTSGGSARLIGAGKALSTSIFSSGGILYTIEPKEGDVMLEVTARMLPAAKPGGSSSLELAKLKLIYRDSGGQTNTATVGPRWLKGDGTGAKLGTHKEVTLKDGKVTDFGVGFMIPKGMEPVAMVYEGAVKIEVPVR